eukprot:sb/3473955/
MCKEFATPALKVSESASLNVIDSHQLQSIWDKSFHPYIFFNVNESCMTFLGMGVDLPHNGRHANLVDGNGDVKEEDFMTRNLYNELKRNEVDFSWNHDPATLSDKLRTRIRQIMNQSFESTEPPPGNRFYCLLFSSTCSYCQLT